MTQYVLLCQGSTSAPSVTQSGAGELSSVTCPGGQFVVVEADSAFGLGSLTVDQGFELAGAVIGVLAIAWVFKTAARMLLPHAHAPSEDFDS